ncbi:MAG: putative entry exclusion protein TrbK-alt [Alphaproteobacteria bacterium]|nr:putative entry exclusion protein TrbK-alt [Alphaproteobacteria bacterium]
MTGLVFFRALMWGAVLAVALSVLVLAGRTPRPPGPARIEAVPEAQPAARDELARCRSAGPDDLACQVAWAAARRRFFGRPGS